MSQTVWLLQFRVLCPGFFQDGDVGVGVLPQIEEVLISSAGWGFVSSERIGTPHLPMCQRTERKIHQATGMIQEFLKLAVRFVPLIETQVGLAAEIGRVKSGRPNGEGPPTSFSAVP